MTDEQEQARKDANSSEAREREVSGHGADNATAVDAAPADPEQEREEPAAAAKPSQAKSS